MKKGKFMTKHMMQAGENVGTCGIPLRRRKRLKSRKASHMADRNHKKLIKVDECERVNEIYGISSFVFFAGISLIVFILLALSAANMYVYNRTEANYQAMSQQMASFRSSLDQHSDAAKGLSEVIVKSSMDALKTHEMIGKDIIKNDASIADIKDELKRIELSLQIISYDKAGKAIPSTEDIKNDVAKLKEAIIHAEEASKPTER